MKLKGFIKMVCNPVFITFLIVFIYIAVTISVILYIYDRKGVGLCPHKKIVFKTDNKSRKIQPIMVVRENAKNIWHFCENGNTEKLSKKSRYYEIHDTISNARNAVGRLKCLVYKLPSFDFEKVRNCDVPAILVNHHDSFPDVDYVKILFQCNDTIHPEFDVLRVLINSVSSIEIDNSISSVVELGDIVGFERTNNANI